MIQGQRTKLPRLAQATLSTWLVKGALTTAALQSRNSPTRYKDAYDNLYQRKRVNNDYEVCIAYCDTNNLIASIFDPRTLTHQQPNGQITEYDIFFYTILAGHFVGTVSYLPPHARGHALPWPDGAFIEIWPGTALPIRKKWPPSPHLTAEAVHEISLGPSIKSDRKKPRPPVPPRKL